MDSLSTLLSLKNTTNTTDLTKLIQQKIYEPNNSGINITLIWVPEHNNIEGNEKADQETKKKNNKTLRHPKIKYNNIRRHKKPNKRTHRNQMASTLEQTKHKIKKYKKKKHFRLAKPPSK